MHAVYPLIPLSFKWCRSQCILRLEGRDLFIDSTSRRFIISPVSGKIRTTPAQCTNHDQTCQFFESKYTSPYHSCVSHVPRLDCMYEINFQSNHVGQQLAEPILQNEPTSSTYDVPRKIRMYIYNSRRVNPC